MLRNFSMKYKHCYECGGVSKTCNDLNSWNESKSHNCSWNNVILIKSTSIWPNIWPNQMTEYNIHTMYIGYSKYMTESNDHVMTESNDRIQYTYKVYWIFQIYDRIKWTYKEMTGLRIICLRYRTNNGKSFEKEILYGNSSPFYMFGDRNIYHIIYETFKNKF